MSINSEEFPKFENFKILGQGETGEVYRAKDKALERHVVIKIYNGYPANELPTIQDYQAQVRKIAALNHENIAQIYSAGFMSGNTPYAIYEYVEGVTLTKYLSENGWWKKLSILGQIIRGMSYAHEKGIIHGDLHNNNILIDKTLL